MDVKIGFWPNPEKRTQTEGVWKQGLMRIYGPKGKDVIGWWRKLHNKEIHNLYFLPKLLGGWD